MSEKLVTIATYWDVVEARLSVVHLKNAGIRSSLQNENSVSMNWLEFANAARGVQLQVAESDVDTALEVLNQKSLATDEVGDAWRLTPESSEGEVDRVDMEETNVNSSDPFDEPLNEHEQSLQRAYHASLLGIAFCPLYFYSLYLLGTSALSSQSVRPSIKTLRWRAIVVTVSFLTLYLLAINSVRR